MAPYAEAGNRALLFPEDVNVDDNNGTVIVGVDNPSILSDLLDLHEKDEPMTVESDFFGTVYKNSIPTLKPVNIPKSATFETIGKS